MMYALGCTGSRTLRPQKQLRTAYKMIDWCLDNGYRTFHHGDCVGADQQLDWYCNGVGLKIVSHPPVDDRYRAFSVNGIILDAKPYLERNHDIVDATDYMLCLPDSFEQKLRSGTWSTIRYSNSVSRPGCVIYPDGTVKTITDALGT